MNPWLVFLFTWTSNVASGAAVYGLGRRYGRGVFRGRVGRRLLSEATVVRIAEQYAKHGEWGIFVSRLLPVWRGVVMPFAGIAGLSAPRALWPLALASAVYYGALTFVVSTLGTNLDQVLRVVNRVNAALGFVAVALLVLGAVWIVRRLKR